MIDFYMAPSPNSKKIKIALEELGLPYKVIVVKLYEGEQLTPEFRKINPNLKVPAIVDHKPSDGGEPYNVFESGAILQYLAEKTGKLLPKDMRGRMLAIQWLTWQVAGLGPMMGQASHFLRYVPKGIDPTYGLNRYLHESRRLLHVISNRLKRVRYLAGDEYSIADIACWPVVNDFAPFLGVDLNEFEHIVRWRDEIRARPAVGRAVNAPEFARGRESTNDQVLTEEERSINFGERLLNAVIED